MTPYRTDAKTDEHRQREADLAFARIVDAEHADEMVAEIERARAWEALKDHAILWACDRVVEVLTRFQRWIRRVTS